MTNLTRDPRIDRLPRWAVAEIDARDQLLAELRRELASLHCEEETDAYWESYDYYKGYLPKHMFLPGGRVTFMLGKDKRGLEHQIEVRLDRTIEGLSSVQVHTSQSGLHVLPQSSNVVQVTTLTKDDI